MADVHWERRVEKDRLNIACMCVGMAQLEQFLPQFVFRKGGALLALDT